MIIQLPLKQIFLDFKIQIKKRDFIFGIKIFMGILALEGALLVERYILSDLVSKELVAEIFVALSVISPLLLLFEAINKRYSSWYFQQMHLKQEEKVDKQVNKIIFLCFVISLFFAFLSPFLGSLYAGEKYTNQSFVVIISMLSLYPFLQLLYQFEERYLLHIDKLNVIAVNSWIASFLFISFVILLIDQMNSIIYASIFLSFYLIRFLLAFATVKFFK